MTQPSAADPKHDRAALLAAGRAALAAGDLSGAERAARTILAQAATDADALQLLAVVALTANRPGAARAILEQAIAITGPHPSLLINLAMALIDLGNAPAAKAVARDVLARQVNEAAAWNALGLAEMTIEHHGAAAAAFQRALALTPAQGECLSNLAGALAGDDRAAEAVTYYTRALTLLPTLPAALAGLARYTRQICHWDGADALQETVAAARVAIDPLALLPWPLSRAAQLENARRWSARWREIAPIQWSPRTVSPRLTLGYLSADFHQHATAWLAARLFELQDRTRFRVIGYSMGRDDQSAMRARLVAGFDDFVDLRDLDDDAAAQRIAADGVDILIDLKGHTRGARPGIMARRPARFQLAWLGFPGSSGMPWIDAIIGDPVVSPPDHQSDFSERIIMLPDSYQPNDDQRPIPQARSKSHYGLPESAIVLVAFNETFKLTPAVFAVWLGLLRDFPDAVLWLMARDPTAQTNLRRVARAADVDPDRLLFAPFLPLVDHLDRYSVSDLFLDTAPYGGHTTMSDALWGGCPAVTMLGETFASRVGASLLNAVGLGELVASDLAGYDRLARDLLASPARRAAIRTHLETKRSTLPLFDSARFARSFDDALVSAWAEFQRSGANSGT